MSTHHTISLWPPITTDTNSKYVGSTPVTINMSTPAAQQPPLEYHHEYTMYSILVTPNHNWYLQIPNVSVTHQLPLPWIPLYTPYSIDGSVFLKIKTIGLIYKNKNEKDLAQPLCHCPWFATPFTRHLSTLPMTNISETKPLVSLQKYSNLFFARQ